MLPTHLQPKVLTAHLAKVVLGKDALETSLDTPSLSITREAKAPPTLHAYTLVPLNTQRLMFLVSKPDQATFD